MDRLAGIVARRLVLLTVVSAVPLTTVTAQAPPPPDPLLASIVGRYGTGEAAIDVFEREGALGVWLGGQTYYPVSLSGDEMLLGDASGTALYVERSAEGRATGLRWAGRRYARRDTATFRITPLRPPSELRQRAAAASPPAEAGPFRAPALVDLARLDSTLHLDVRYATSNNFMGEPFYEVARAFLQQPAAEALRRVQQDLRADGLGLIVYDAYRPWHVTKMFWEATPPEQRAFVANPANGSRHNRGCAVDVGLYDVRTGRPVEMPSGYDEFTPRAHSDYAGGTSRQRWYRARLREAMERHGFAVLPEEWWHFDHADWRRYPLLNEPLGAVDASE